jgi:hypothetical protein
MPKVVANGKTFNFPEGTTNDQIGEAIDEYFASTSSTPIQNDLGDAPDVFNQFPEPEQVPEQESSFADSAIGAGEAAFTLATGATGGLLGTVGGVAEGVFDEVRSGEFGTPEAANRIADSASQGAANLTYAPRTEEGQEIVQSIGELAEPLAPLAGLAGPLTQVAQVSRLAQPQVAGAARVAVDKAGSGVATISRAKLPSTRSQVRELMKGEVNRDTFNLELSKDTIENPSSFQKLIGADLPNVGKNREAINAANQGFDEGFLDVIEKRATPQDNKAMIQMTRISKRGKQDPLYEVDNRPADVAGNVLLDKINNVKKINKDAGRAIDAEANKLKEARVDVASIGTSFKNSLDDLDVVINDDMTLNFDNSFLKSMGGPKKSIKLIFDEMSKNQNPTAFDLHKLKRFIDEQVSYGKNVRGLGGSAERSLKSLRKNINNTLGDNFPSYAKANKAYSQTIGALDEIQRLAGKNTDLSSNSADGSLGVLSRRLMSNAQSRGQLNEAIKAIDSSIETFDGFSVESNRLPNPNKTKSPNLKLLMLYADELDKVVGTPARTSLTGALDTSLDAAKNAQSQTAVGLAIDAAKELNRKRKGISREGAYKSMESILNKGNK